VDIGRFEATAPGELVRIADNEYAFVPNDLPPRWDFSLGLWPLLADAKQQLGILEGLGRTLPNPGILLRPLEDREAVKSSRLEGTYVTAKELILFELRASESRPDEEPTNDRREVLNYRIALREGTSTDLPLSLRLVRKLHETLLFRVRGMDPTPGQFRRVQVAIGSEHRFVPPPPERLKGCLESMEKHFHVVQSGYDPLVECFLIHYQFETIHPFADGNGRVGRLLLAMMLKDRCELSKPWLYMSEYFERNREEYVQKLFNVSALGDWEGWIEFCLRGVADQARDTIQRCDRLRSIRDDFAGRLAGTGGSVRLNQIAEDIFSSPFVRIADLPKRLHITYPTAKADVERLVRVGVLMELANVTPKTFYSPEVFNVAYERME
jgi:Fic family protein